MVNKYEFHRKQDFIKKYETSKKSKNISGAKFMKEFWKMRLNSNKPMRIDSYKF